MAAWLMVTVGRVLSKVTVLSRLTLPRLVLPAASLAPPAGMLAMTVPSEGMPLTATL